MPMEKPEQFIKDFLFVMAKGSRRNRREALVYWNGWDKYPEERHDCISCLSDLVGRVRNPPPPKPRDPDDLYLTDILWGFGIFAGGWLIIELAPHVILACWEYALLAVFLFAVGRNFNILYPVADKKGKKR